MVNEVFDKFSEHVNKPNVEGYVACNIVKEVFKNVNLCIKNDRSKTKLNMFEKGIISGMLSEKTLNGINGYILNMYDTDVKSLMGDILHTIPTEMLELESQKRRHV